MNDYNNNFKEVDTRCVHCGADSGWEKVQTSAKIEFVCKTCGYRMTVRNENAPEYAEYQSERRKLVHSINKFVDGKFSPKCSCGSTHFTENISNANGFEYTCKKCEKLTFDTNIKKCLDDLDKLFEKYPDLCSTDPIIDLLYIKIFSKDFNEINEKVKYYERQYRGNLFLSIEDVDESKGYVSQLIALIKANEPKPPRPPMSATKKKTIIALTLVALILAIVGFVTYYVGLLSFLGESFLRKINVTYYMDDSYAETNTVQVVLGKDYNLELLPEKTGYTYIGLYDSKRDGNLYFDENGKFVKKYGFDKDITLYPRFEKIVLNYNLNESSLKLSPSLSGNKFITSEDGFSDFAIPTCNYYIFDGWYSKETGGVKIADGNGSKIVDMNYELLNELTSLSKGTYEIYAHWVKKHADYNYIATVKDLVAINDNMTANYMLINDVDMSSYEQWLPIGGYYAEKAFSGIFDGNNYTIRNLTRTSDVAEKNNASYFGLFGYTKDATLKNLKFSNVKIDVHGPAVNNNSMKAYFATLVGYGVNTKIENIEANGKVSYDCDTNGASYLGGVIGLSDNCKLISVINNQQIWGKREHIASGGICGYSKSIEIKNCVNNAKIYATGNGWFGSGWSYAGGIIGFTANASLIVTDLYENNGTLSAETYGSSIGMNAMKKGNLYGNL